VTVALLLGATSQLARTIAPKSATSPIAMAVSEHLGGIPALTAVLVIGTGVFGAIAARSLLNALRIESHAARGLALGVAAHGIGTARAFQVSPEMGAWAGLGMGLNGVLTALLAPWLVPLLLEWFGK
jgi:putative effector of murein hydrolase